MAQLVFRNLRLFRAGDYQDHFSLGISVPVDARQLGDGAALELLELLGQLTGDDRGAFSGASFDKGVERRAYSVSRFEEYRRRRRRDDITDCLRPLFSL